MNKQMIQAGEIQLAVYTWGQSPRPEQPREIIILAHGFPDRALLWEKVARELETDFFVVAFDMRGCGESEGERGRLIVEEEVRDAIAAHEFLEAQDFFSGMVKAAVFGFLVTLMGCYHGYHSKGGAQGVGQATTNAVVSASILILCFNYMLTEAFFSV